MPRYWLPGRAIEWVLEVAVVAMVTIWDGQIQHQLHVVMQ